MDNNLLVVAEKLDVAVVFSDKGMAKLLDEIKTKVIAHVPDTETEQGRKDIISLAYKITRSKTLIDDLGKGVVADWKKKAKLIDEHRKTARDFLDDLKNTARQPLTDWEAEQAIIKEMEEAAEKEKIQARIDTLFALNVVLPFFDLAVMSDTDYETLLISATEAYKGEQDRIAKEKQARQEEEARLAIERAEIERIKVEQETRTKALAEKEEALKAQEKAIEDAKRKEVERQAQIEWQQKETERLRIQAEADAKAKIEKEAREKKEKEEAEKAERLRVEALRPDKVKLEQWIESILSTPEPELSNKKARELLEAMVDGINQVLATYQKRIKKL